MAPLYSAAYASLYERATDDDGQTYIAQMICGEMMWIMDVDMSFIRELSEKPKKNNKKTKDQTGGKYRLPAESAYQLEVGDIRTGGDGNEYIVKLVGNKKQWTIHQKIYKWSKSGVMYKTLDNSVTDNESSSRIKTSRKSSNKSSKNN